MKNIEKNVFVALITLSGGFMIQDRSLNVLADGAPAADGCHIRLRGKTTVSLYPDLFLLNIRNLSEASFFALGNGGT